MDRGEPAGQEVQSGSRLPMMTTTTTAAAGATGMGVAVIGGGMTGMGLSGRWFTTGGLHQTKLLEANLAESQHLRLDLFEAPSTPEAKPSKSKSAKHDGSRGPSPGSSDDSGEDEEAEAKKKAAKAKTKEQKKHHAKYMRFYSTDRWTVNASIVMYCTT